MNEDQGELETWAVIDRHFNGTLRTHEDALHIPLRWNTPKRIFVNSMSDLFHEAVPFDFVDKVFAVMALCPQHTFQVLTKRPERMAEYLASGKPVAADDHEGRYRKIKLVWRIMVGGREDSEARGRGWPLPNVWLGTSVENQESADERIPHLLRCPAAARFLSVEPMLGEIGIFGPCRYHAPVADGNAPVDCGGCDGYGRAPLMELANQLHWVICGGESGPGRTWDDLPTVAVPA